MVEMEALRAKAAADLEQLALDAMADETNTSWLGEDLSQVSERCRLFHHAGFLHVPNFYENPQILKDAMRRLVETQWTTDHALDSFGTNDQQNKMRGDYFLESSNKVHFFAEPHALDDNNQLREEYSSDRMTALNKVGHALHIQPGPFREYCLDSKVRELVCDLGWKDPVVPQSMYIFKQALHGAEVTSHQDSTFLYTTPRQTCLGLWLALDDATLENGCLWLRPRSHREPVRRQYKRNPEHFGNESIETRSNEAKGDASAAKLIMEELSSETNATDVWDGKVPPNGWDGLLEAGFLPVECKAGDLLVFCGTLDHLSLPNTSDGARHTFQLHLVDGPEAGVTWSPSNWLQYPGGAPFIRLLESIDL